jgi:hypothetical protein
VVVPYSTWLSEFSFVFQEMVAPVALMPPAATLEMTGAIVSISTSSLMLEIVASTEALEEPAPMADALALNPSVTMI